MKRLSLILAIVAFASPVFAQCGFQVGAVQTFSTINLFPINATSGGSISGITDDAVALWSRDCNGMGTTYPSLNVTYTTAPPADMSVAIIFNQGVSTDPAGRCGHTTTTYDETAPSIPAMRFGNSSASGSTQTTMESHNLRS